MMSLSLLAGRTVAESLIQEVNTLPASGEFCHLLQIFANSLDLEQTCKNVGLDQDLKYMTL